VAAINRHPSHRRLPHTKTPITTSSPLSSITLFSPNLLEAEPKLVGAMAVDLTPRQPRKAYGGEGGAYYEWSPADLPMLGVASIGAAKLSLAAGGLSLPSYSDSAKVAYVLQGTRTTRPSSPYLFSRKY
jgi:hypothetical protein